MHQPATKISLFVFLLLIISCKKHDYCDPPPKTESCDLAQSLVTPFVGEPYSQFRKEYDPATGKVRKVVTGIYYFRLFDSIPMLLRYNGSTAYFLDETNPSDTFLIATFDAHNRLRKLAEGNATTDDGIFFTTEFIYSAHRLWGYTVAGYEDTVRLTYDGNGNLTRMYIDQTSATEGTFFTYDLSVKATGQWYSEYFLDGAENVLYLTQFMGWLPDLTPVNKRTSFKIVLRDEDPNDDIPPPVLLDGNLTDHVYDNEGKLLSYKANDNTYINTWNCNMKGNAWPD